MTANSDKRRKTVTINRNGRSRSVGMRGHDRSEYAVIEVEEHTGTQVILVSKDINLRIKAAMLGIRAEDYHSDQVLDRFKGWPHSAHITLRRGERSRLANYASNEL